MCPLYTLDFPITPAKYMSWPNLESVTHFKTGWPGGVIHIESGRKIKGYLRNSKSFSTQFSNYAHKKNRLAHFKTGCLPCPVSKWAK